MSKKTILITAGEDIILRNIFCTDFWQKFKALTHDKDWRIIVATSSELASKANRILGNGVEIVTYERGRISKIEEFVLFLTRNGSNTNTNHWEKMRAYADGRANISSTLFKRMCSAIIGRSVFVRRLLRSILLKLPSDKQTAKFYDDIKPDVCVPLSLTRYDFDVPLAKASRQRGIPTIGMVRSWDNLTSHGLLNVVPEILFLQNQFLVQAAAKYQVIPRTTHIEQVGLPHYDRYSDAESRVIPREKLFAFLNLNPAKKLILYGAMGEFLFKREAEMPRVLNRMIQKARLGESAQVLFRSHPTFPPHDDWSDLEHVRAHIPKSYTATEGEWSSEDVLMSTVYHSDLVITCGSTFAVDAFVLNRPVICIGFDGESTVDYWHSAARFYDTYTHYEAFMAASRTPLARSADELASLVKKQLGKNTADPDARRNVIDLFVAPFDGQAGKRLAECIVEAGQNVYRYPRLKPWY